jgi:NAD/NADP transhydrogenase beta subunit
MTSELGLTTAAYVVAAVLFILALGGLSNQEKAKQAIWYGIIGMALAIFATVSTPDVPMDLTLLAMIAIGGVGGWYVAKKVQMTQMPELVAGFHSLVGLAAVLIGFNADSEMTRALAAVEAGTAKELSGFAATIAKKSGAGAVDPAGRIAARHLHRRDHLHGLDRRLWQAGRPDQLQRADAALSPPAQPRRHRRPV